jgi:hypothetical protein
MPKLSRVVEGLQQRTQRSHDVDRHVAVERRLALDRQAAVYSTDCATAARVSVDRMARTGVSSMLATAPLPSGVSCTGPAPITRAPDGTLFVAVGGALFQMLAGAR